MTGLSVTLGDPRVAQYCPPQYKYGIVRDQNVRGDELNFYPNTVPMQDRPQGAEKGADIMIGSNMWNLIRRVNNDAGWGWARSVGKMMINSPYDAGLPTERIAPSESVTCGRSFFASDWQTETHAHLVSFNYLDPTDSLDTTIYNWDFMPHLFFKANAIRPNTHDIIKIGDEAIDAVWPRVSRTDLFLPLETIEFFPTPPIGITYELRGTDVYARVNDGRDPLIPLAVAKDRVWDFKVSWFYLGTLPNLPRG